MSNSQYSMKEQLILSSEWWFTNSAKERINIYKLLDNEEITRLYVLYVIYPDDYEKLSQIKCER